LYLYTDSCIELLRRVHVQGSMRPWSECDVCGCDRPHLSRRRSFIFALINLPLWQALRFQDKMRLRHGAYSRLPCSIPCRPSETACHRACERHGTVSITTPQGCPFITSIALLLFCLLPHTITGYSSIQSLVAAGLPPTCLRRIPYPGF
jgi:hypothetical protein